MNARALLLILGPALAGCHSGVPDSAAPAATPQKVLVEPVRWSDESLPVPATAILRRKSEAALSFKVAGIIHSVPVRAGDVVRQGQVLAELRQEEIESQVSQALAAAAEAQRQHARLAALASRHAVSRQDAENAATRVEVATAVLRAAEFNRRFSRITAPADGRILRRLGEAGELVAAGKPVLEFGSDCDGWIATARVTEADAARLRNGDRAELSLTATGGTALAATVTQIAAATDPATRTVEVEMRVDEVPPGAGSGFLARAVIHPQPVVPRPQVPLASLVDGEGLRAALFVVAADNRTAVRVPVEIEAITPDGAFLRGSLDPGRLLVVAGADFLRDGLPLDPRPADPAPQAFR